MWPFEFFDLRSGWVGRSVGRQYIHTYIDLTYVNTFITTKGPLWPLTMLCELKAKRSIKYF